MSALLRRRAALHSGHLASGALAPVPRFPGSPGQRTKVARAGCAVCGRGPVDPAHLVPQRLGGCHHPDCVIGLCRTHHRLFDGGRLRLAPYLGERFAAERAHAILHVGAAELERALQSGWPAPWEPITDDQGARR